MEIKPILKVRDTPLTPDEQRIADTAASYLKIARQLIWEINTRLTTGGRPSSEAWYLALQLDNLCDYIKT